MSGGGEERRVGKRAEQKRQWDASAKHPCADGCGRLVWRDAGRCVACSRARREARQKLILVLWDEGATQREIAANLGTTPESIQVTLVHMRQKGWHVARRGPRGQRNDLDPSKRLPRRDTVREPGPPGAI